MSVESYLATVKRMVQWAIRDVNALISTVDMSDPDGARDALQAELPTLIAVWGEVAATAAAEYFEELVGSTAVLADAIEPAAIESMVGWAVGPLYGELKDDGSKIPPDPAKARRNLVGASQKHVLNTGRNTIRQNAESTPGVGWARVLQGETNCAFCVVLASRGAVYETAQTAGAQTVTDERVTLGDRFHSHCDCQCLPVRDERDYPDGYDPEVYYEQYMAARRNADLHPVFGYKTLKGGDNNILTQMRKMYGMH